LILSFKGRTLDEFLIPKERAVIGSSPDCDVHIDSLAVEPHHARISVNDGCCMLEDLQTPSGTFVNGQKVSSHPLHPGDTIQVGKHTLTFLIEQAAAAGVEDAPAQESEETVQVTGWLQITSGSNMGKTIRLSRPVTNIGQRGQHTAMIARRKDGYYLSYLQGESPPRVGGREIADESRALHDGDIIELGNVKMQFYLTDEQHSRGQKP